MNSNPTDLQAALRKACEDAAKYLPEPRGISDADVADIIERHLTPVFEALVAAAYAACAKHLPPLPDATLVSCSCGAYFSSRVAWQAHIHSLTPTDAAWELERRELEASLPGNGEGRSLNAHEQISQEVRDERICNWQLACWRNVL